MGRTHSYAHYLLTYHHNLRDIKKSQAALKVLKKPPDKADFKAYDRRLRALRRRVMRAKARIKHADEYIKTIEDSYVRQAMFYHFTKDYSWLYTATKIGRPDAVDTIRIMVTQYIRELAIPKGANRS